MVSANRSINLELSVWANKGVNLWCVDLQTIDLVQGVSSYDLPSNTVTLLDVYVETQLSEDDQPTDRIMSSLGRSEYAAIPNKTIQSFPTSFWFDRTISPTVHIWPTPDGNGPYVLKFYRMRQVQDASASMGQTADIPYRFLEALCAGLTYRLAVKYAPEKASGLKMEAAEMWEIARTEDRERVTMFITPAIDAYWRL